jgi:transposase-like protein
MTVNPHSNDLSTFVAERLERAEPDLLRSMLSTFVQVLMSAEADALCGASYGSRSAERVNSRNGYRARDFDTRAGTVRSPSRSCGRAPTSLSGCWSDGSGPNARWCRWSRSATCSGSVPAGWRSWSRRWEITRLSKSQVSVMARELDEQVADFRTRPLDQGSYTFVAADALTMKVREGAGW